MNNLILEDGSPQRCHRRHLHELLSSTTGTLRFATAYVTDCELLTRTPDRKRCLLLSLCPMDVASGATSLESLGTLIKSGVECRTLPDRPRLHAKVYIFGSTHAVVSSANLTRNAFDTNIEAGIELHSDHVSQLTGWFDGLWKVASPLNLGLLSELQSKARLLRQEYMKLKKKAKSKLQVTARNNHKPLLSDELRESFANAIRYFVCNTDRRHGERTATRGYALEEEMLYLFTVPDGAGALRAAICVGVGAKLADRAFAGAR